MLAMEHNDNAGFQDVRVIVNVHREHARSYKGTCESVPSIEIHFPAQRLARLIRPQVLDKQLHHHRR